VTHAIKPAAEFNFPRRLPSPPPPAPPTQREREVNAQDAVDGEHERKPAEEPNAAVPERHTIMEVEDERKQRARIIPRPKFLAGIRVEKEFVVTQLVRLSGRGIGLRPGSDAERSAWVELQIEIFKRRVGIHGRGPIAQLHRV